MARDIATRATAAQRAAKALELRTGGASYAQIATTLGFANPSAAHKAVKRSLARIPAEGVGEMRRVHGATLDEIRTRLMQRLRSGDVSVVPLLHRNLDQAARLFGLYQPISMPHDPAAFNPAREVFGGFMLQAQAFAQQRGQLEELVLISEREPS